MKLLIEKSHFFKENDDDNDLSSVLVIMQMMTAVALKFPSRLMSYCI